MKFLILSENSNGAWPYLHYRGMGAFELKKRIKSRGYECDIIDWFTRWSHGDLKLVIENFFKDTEYPVIAVSTPFDHQDLGHIEEVIVWARVKYPNIKIIHGGARTFKTEYQYLADIFFLGRSMQIFDDWLDKKDISKYKINDKPLILVNHNFDQNIDNPVLPIIDDSDCLTHRDILGFEVGVGCKFNCTFCNYELRNVKITKLLDPYELKNYFTEAYSKYGIVEYFTSDDTINETDEKLEIIAEAMSGLNFHPRITAFARLDLINSRKKQQELLKQIQFRALFFGIESFNPEAAKTIRKKTGFGNIYETLGYIRDNCPDTFTIGSIIVGLNRDNLESIKSSLNRVVDEKLLTSVQIYTLNIVNANGVVDPYYLSDLDKNPEKFGYKITDFGLFHKGNHTLHDLHWESDWINYTKAEQISQSLSNEYEKKMLVMNHFEWTGFYAMGLIKSKNPVNMDVLKSKGYSVSTQLKEQYIANKLRYLGLKQS
jgi:lipoate synthase